MAVQTQRFITTNYIMGDGALRTIAENYGDKRIGLVIDENLMKVTGLDKVLYEDILKDCDYKVICNTVREPERAKLEKYVEVAQEYQPEVIVAIGGGSVMDSGKIMWMFLEHPEYDWERAKAQYDIEPFTKGIELIAVPTTSGTGSETTGCAMFTEYNGYKSMFLCDNIIPTKCILDWDLYKSLPPRQVAFCGADALAHALEAGVTRITSDMVEIQAVAASVDIIKYIKASQSGDLTARKKMAIAATTAGAAINNSCCGMAHGTDQPAADFNLPHGLMMGLALPYTMRMQLPQPVYGKVADQLGITGADEVEKQSKLVDMIVDLFKDLGIPATLKEAGASEEVFLEKLDGYVEMAQQSFNNIVAPIDPTPEEYRELFNKYYYGE